MKPSVCAENWRQSCYPPGNCHILYQVTFEDDFPFFPQVGHVIVPCDSSIFPFNSNFQNVYILDSTPHPVTVTVSTRNIILFRRAIPIINLYLPLLQEWGGIVYRSNLLFFYAIDSIDAPLTVTGTQLPPHLLHPLPWVVEVDPPWRHGGRVVSTSEGFCFDPDMKALFPKYGTKKNHLKLHGQLLFHSSYVFSIILLEWLLGLCMPKLAEFHYHPSSTSYYIYIYYILLSVSLLGDFSGLPSRTQIQPQWDFINVQHATNHLTDVHNIHLIYVWMNDISYFTNLKKSWQKGTFPTSPTVHNLQHATIIKLVKLCLYTYCVYMFIRIYIYIWMWCLLSELSQNQQTDSCRENHSSMWILWRRSYWTLTEIRPRVVSRSIVGQTTGGSTMDTPPIHPPKRKKPSPIGQLN